MTSAAFITFTRGLSRHVLDLWRKMRETAVGPGAGAERLELRPD